MKSVMKLQAELGDALRQRREKLGLSQSAAGERATPLLLQKTVSHIENASQDVAVSTVLAYAAGLGLELRPVAPRRR